MTPRNCTLVRTWRHLQSFEERLDNNNNTENIVMEYQISAALVVNIVPRSLLPRVLAIARSRLSIVHVTLEPFHASSLCLLPVNIWFGISQLLEFFF